MKLSKVMLAVATLAVSASAMAAPASSRIAISAGASATRINLITAVSNLCVSGGGVASSLGSGNFRAIVCADTAVTEGAAGTYVSKPNANFRNFAGTSFAEFRFNTEGSFSAVLILNGATPQVRDPAAAAASAVYPAGSVIVGGLLDIAPDLGFPPATIGTNTLFPATAVGIAQTFGVAVSSSLYGQMFNDQKATGFLPAACVVGDTALPYCVPSIGAAQMATIMADNPFNAAYTKGANFLASTIPSGDELRYIRRVDNSGTQASAQNYFLGLPCSKNELAITPEPTTDDEAGGLRDALLGAIRVLAAPGTGDVIAELAGAGYSIGVVSGENIPAGNWRWLRVNGANMAENANPAGNSNTATMKGGKYDFFFESVYMGGSAAGNAFWSTVSTTLNTLPGLPGLVNNADLTAGYSKGGLACARPASN